MPSTSSSNKLSHKYQFEAIGTWWSIETERELGDLRERIAERIDVFDKAYSRFRADSLVTTIAKEVGTYVFPDDVVELIGFYQELYGATDGAVSPLVGGILDAAGYDKEYSLQPNAVVSAPAWDEVMQWQGATVQTRQLALLDFGAAGKGYLVDIVAALLERAGHETYIIDASGDVLTRGSREVIGLEDPDDPTRVLGAVSVENASLCASATTRRSWGEWHHIVDPRSAVPVSKVSATWVIARTTLIADGLATALFFVPAAVLARWDFEYIRLFADGSVERSRDFVGELYI